MKIHSIFRSIDGEVNYWGQGTQTTFVRMQGCNLDCAYCDTEYARDPNLDMEMRPIEVFQKVQEFKTEKVTITGGEPYLQEQALGELLYHLRDHDVSIETNGSFMKQWVVCHVMDYKLPSSKMEQHMDFDNFADLYGQDFVKFVIQDKYDFSVATHIMPELKARGCRARFAFSPVYGVLDPAMLLNWMEQEGIYDAILNVQLHKMLGIA